MRLPASFAVLLSISYSGFTSAKSIQTTFPVSIISLKILFPFLGSSPIIVGAETPGASEALNTSIQKVTYRISASARYFFNSSFINGTNITFPTSSTINLAVGGIYNVSFGIRATLSLAGFMSITTNFNGVAQNNFIAKAVNTLTSSDVSVSLSFLVDARAAAVTLSFTFGSGTTGTSAAGYVSVYRIQ